MRATLVSQWFAGVSTARAVRGPRVRRTLATGDDALDGTSIAQAGAVTRDRIEMGLLVISFAALLTTHVALTIGLTRRRPRWRAIVAFLLPPLAPWWCCQERMRGRAVVWIVAALLYGVMLVVASAGG